MSLGNRKRGDLVGPLGHEPTMLRFDFMQSADSRTQDHTATKPVFFVEVEARIGNRIDAGDQRELGKAIDTLSHP